MNNNKIKCPKQFNRNSLVLGTPDERLILACKIGVDGLAYTVLFVSEVNRLRSLGKTLCLMH